MSLEDWCVRVGRSWTLKQIDGLQHSPSIFVNPQVLPERVKIRFGNIGRSNKASKVHIQLRSFYINTGSKLRSHKRFESRARSFIPSIWLSNGKCRSLPDHHFPRALRFRFLGHTLTIRLPRYPSLRNRCPHRSHWPRTLLYVLRLHLAQKAHP